ncbi:MAG: hypothetical protein JNK82_11145, partial [Myxococcaceae bacterium]|nr:hypothetical protein [Myxococcaceae bacterium]
MTYYWAIDSSTLAFGEGCTDDPDFRATQKPLVFDSDGHLIYRLAPDGLTAPMLACTSSDPATCRAANNGIVFDVEGPELKWFEQQRTPAGFGGCVLLSSWSWLLT